MSTKDLSASHVFGQMPRPRALIVGFGQEIAERLAALFPTSRVVKSLEEVHEPEWDVLLTTEGSTGDANLFVIGFGPSPMHLPKPTKTNRDPRMRPRMNLTGTSVSKVFSVPKAVDDRVKQIVTKKLIPSCNSRTSNGCLILGVGYPGSRGNVIVEPDAVETLEEVATPFLVASDGSVLAGKYLRDGKKAGVEGWFLPMGVDHVEWTQAALAQWHEVDPRTFPQDPSWRSKSDWFTHEQLRAQEELDRLSVQWTEFEAEHQAREAKALESLEDAEKRADRDERGLLVFQSEPLVDAVRRCLVDFGFDVQDMDKVFPANDRREDLRVTLPNEDPNWIAIVEIKGHKGGASINDLLKISRWATRFVADEKKMPSRCWFIVNQFLGDDPADRQAPLAGNPEELKEYADADGLVCDTKELFLAWRALKANPSIKNAIRQQLKASKGRFEFSLPDQNEKTQAGLPDSD